MKKTFISKPTSALARVACLWLVHAEFGAMDAAVSGRTIG